MSCRYRTVLSGRGLVLISLALAAALVGGACGGGDGESPAEPMSSESTPASAEPEPAPHSLSGEPLYPMALDEEQRVRLESNLADAKAAFDAAPDEEENIIWYGRRLAYLWRYREAIDVFSAGIERHPESYRLLRHRGHRYITVREFENAIADLERAAELIDGIADEVEQDGAPNAAGIPRSTSHTNIWYHLGLAYYLTGQFDKAASAYESCLEFSKNDDMLIATLDWQYMTLRRLGRDEDANAVLEAVSEEMDILENHSYHRRLLMYKGLVSPDELLAPEGASSLELATQGYGVANWYWVNGDEERAISILEQILDGDYWAAFGYIAAEADLERLDAGG